MFDLCVRTKAESAGLQYGGHGLGHPPRRQLSVEVLRRGAARVYLGRGPHEPLETDVAVTCLTCTGGCGVQAEL